MEQWTNPTRSAHVDYLKSQKNIFGILLKRFIKEQRLQDALSLQKELYLLNWVIIFKEYSPQKWQEFINNYQEMLYFLNKNTDTTDTWSGFWDMKLCKMTFFRDSSLKSGLHDLDGRYLSIDQVLKTM